MSEQASKIPIDSSAMNRAAVDLLESTVATELQSAGEIVCHQIAGAAVWDFGLEIAGSDKAGILLARLSASDLLSVEMEIGPESTHVFVSSKQPVLACLGSQYAGWPVSIEKYFAMASGPGRILRGKEPLWDHFDVVHAQAGPAVLVLESNQLPTSDVVEKLAGEMKVDTKQVSLCVAPTNSLAGTLQIVARSLETALHQWESQNGPLDIIVGGSGRAPLPPLGKNSLESIGLTNDAIIYGSEVTLEIEGDWELVRPVAERVPSENSESFGQSFMELFKAAGHDFYKMDARLFSPAVLKLSSTRVQDQKSFGSMRPELACRRS